VGSLLHNPQINLMLPFLLNLETWKICSNYTPSLDSLVLIHAMAVANLTQLSQRVLAWSQYQWFISKLIFFQLQIKKSQLPWHVMLLFVISTDVWEFLLLKRSRWLNSGHFIDIFAFNVTTCNWKVVLDHELTFVVKYYRNL
jgi:hypothetical protein